MGDRLYHRTWERWLSVRTFARTNIFTDLPFLLLCSPDFREELFLCAHQCCAATANRPCNIARRRHRSCMPYRGRVIAFPVPLHKVATHRSESRRVGKDCGSTCDARWGPAHQATK